MNLSEIAESFGERKERVQIDKITDSYPGMTVEDASRYSFKILTGK